MADEVRLWRIGAGDSLTEVGRDKLDLESRLEDWLDRDISVLDASLLVIGRQVETDFGGFIDLLCVDQAGDLVIVELKRDRTPREITAQALDYASWVGELTDDKVAAIANSHLGQDFETAFRARFGTELPDTLNAHHRMLIVGSEIDASSERIIRYLSQSYGVDINAATFHYFREDDSSELLARLFVVEPAEVERRANRSGKLTYDELRSRASDSGVGELYEYVVMRLGAPLRKYTTRSSLGYSATLNGSNKSILSVSPGASQPGKLRFQLYKTRFAELTGLTTEEVMGIAPTSREDWLPYQDGGPEWEGLQGFIVAREEVDRLAAALARAPEAPAADELAAV
jgi:hypothetical protein